MSAAHHPAQDILRAMPQHFNAEAAAGAEAIIGITLTGADGGDWQISVLDGACVVTPETPAAPHATMTLSPDDFVRLMDGTLNPLTAVMSRRLTLGGETSLLLKLEKWFSL